MNRLSAIGRVVCGAMWVALAGAHAQPMPAPLPDEDARLTALATHPTWRHLLHWSAEHGHSEVTSAGFFLAPNGRDDALAELRATLAAGQDPLPEGVLPEQHPRCRWPARYAWLMQQGVLAEQPVRPAGCRSLNAWVRWDELDGISVMLVSGYLGNPASTFGHALLRLDTRSGQLSGGRLDVSVNFGARVPDQESPLRYIFNGLTGRYSADFSDKPFYANDLVYAHTEFRDMWVYRLALTEAQRTLLALHLWEMLGQSFDYYFLNRNCALRLAELVELATGRPVVGPHTGWYVPVELFQALHQEEAHGPALLAGPPQFRPSAERVLAQHFAQLSPAARAVARTLLRHDLAELEMRLASLPLDEQQAVLEALLAWFEQRLVADRQNAEALTWRQHKDRLLLARLRRPAQVHAAEIHPPELPSPALGHAPGLLSLGVSQEASGHRQVRGEAAVFSYELGGAHGLERGELVALAARWQTRTDPGSARRHSELAALDVLRILKLSDPTDPTGGQAAWSWRVQLGWNREAMPGTISTAPVPLRAQASGGIGLAWPRSQWGDAWVLLGTRWRESGAALGWGPQLGWLVYGRDGMRMVGEHAWEWRAGHAAPQSTHRLGWVLPTTQNQAWRLQWQRQASVQDTSLVWQCFF